MAAAMHARAEPPECRLEVFSVRFETPEGLSVRRDVRTLARGVGPDALAREVAAANAARGRRPFVHSTSWRYEEGAVVLTYLAVVSELRLAREVRHLVLDALGATGEQVPAREGDPRPASVLWHGLRHLALLARERPKEIGARLPTAAREALRRLRPAPATKAERS